MQRSAINHLKLYHHPPWITSQSDCDGLSLYTKHYTDHHHVIHYLVGLIYYIERLAEECQKWQPCNTPLTGIFNKIFVGYDEFIKPFHSIGIIKSGARWGCIIISSNASSHSIRNNKFIIGHLRQLFQFEFHFNSPTLWFFIIQLPPSLSLSSRCKLIAIKRANPTWTLCSFSIYTY